jgi:hypothetical protein
MKRILKSAVPAVLLLVLLLPISPAAQASSKVQGECDEATANALGEEYDLNPFANPFASEPAKMSPLCGEFLGPGSEAMADRALPATCGGYAGWAVFRHEADGSWELVMHEADGAWDLEAVGNDLEETDRILGPNDARCTGKTATKARLWHWNGKEFVAGPWAVHPIGLTPSFIANPGHYGIDCRIADNPKVPKLPGHFYHNGVSCVSYNHRYVQKAELWPGGKTKACRTHQQEGCGGGTSCGCAFDAVEVHTGEQVVLGRFTCQIGRKSVRCTITTGRKAGRGFVINQNRIKRLK